MYFKCSFGSKFFGILSPWGWGGRCVRPGYCVDMSSVVSFALVLSAFAFVLFDLRGRVLAFSVFFFLVFRDRVVGSLEVPGRGGAQ